ncbi:methyltransferase [Dongia sp.]|uniref:methyltransferase n=1 Tax=Dongia sp. TaxID=1977262 RepID=UPI0035B0AF01
MPILTPDTINRLEAGVPPALALLAGMELEVFTALAKGPRTPDVLAADLGVDSERLSRLLYALALTNLVTYENGNFANSPEAATFLVKGSPRYIGGGHELTREIWEADLKTAESIRRGAPAALHDFAEMDEASLTAFLRGMIPFATATGRALGRQFDFSGVRSIVDVGGGSGAALAGLMEQHAAMRGTLFELPSVAKAAAVLLDDFPCRDRIDIATGDITTEPLKGQHDAALLRALVQVLAPEDAAKAIRHAVAGLRPGGHIYITGSGILNDDRLTPPAGVYLNVTLMNFYPSGRSYTNSEHVAWLKAAGCTDPVQTTLRGGSEVIRATKT